MRAAAAVALAALAASAAALRFPLSPGSRRCFTEDLPTSSRIRAEVRVADGKGAMEIDVWVTTLKGAVLWHRRAPDHGKFAFTTPPATRTEHSGIDSDEEDDEEYGWMDETYRVCVEHQAPAGMVHAPDSSRMVYLSVSETRAGDSESGSHAKSDAANNLQMKMRVMHESLSLLIGDLTKLQQRERKLVKRVGTTNGRLAWLCGTAVLVSAITSAIQYQYYKTYFTQKKLC